MNDDMAREARMRHAEKGGAGREAAHACTNMTNMKSLDHGAGGEIPPPKAERSLYDFATRGSKVGAAEERASAPVHSER